MTRARAAAVAIIALVACIGPIGYTAASRTPLTTSATGYGVRITVSLPRHLYRPGAETVARVTLTNLTGHPVTLKGDPFICQGTNPAVIPVTRDGRVQYPNAIPGPYCPPHPTPHLAPHQTLSTTIHFILGRPWIIGRLTILVSPRSGVRTPETIRTPILRLPTPHNAVLPPCPLNQEYRPGYCFDQPGELTVGPTPNSHGFEAAIPVRHLTFGSVMLKVTKVSGLVHDEIPVVVYGQLLDRGKPILRAQMTATWHYIGGIKVCRAAAGPRGVMMCVEPALAYQSQDLQRIPVDVVVTAHGHTYATEVSYTPSSD